MPVGEYTAKGGDVKTEYEEMRFLDNFRFLPEILNSFYKSLNNFDFNILREHFPDESKNVSLMQKRIYLYSFIDSFEKFNEEKLPNFRASWTNTLSED